MQEKFRQMARQFVEEEKEFHLGFLPTEQSNPLSRTLEEDFRRETAAGVRTLQRCDREILAMARKMLKSEPFRQLADGIFATITRGGRVIFSGCGATGRLSIVLESMWKEACSDGTLPAGLTGRVESIMTGGDYALVRSVESFEDHLEFGRQQVREAGMTAADTLVAITEGGETSSVLGTVDQALQNGSKVFLLFNNPANLLTERLERSRRAITDPRVTVLDLYCGPMALAGSTRMQATTSEQLIAGAALELAACRISGKPVVDYAAEFDRLLAALEQAAPVIARGCELEAACYRRQGLVTYLARSCMLDIFTDTTERSPTFMIPPYRKNDDALSPLPWAQVKDPVLSTREVWARHLHRVLRCLEWSRELYAQMGAPAKVIAHPPAIGAAELMKFEVGCEHFEERWSTGNDLLFLVTAGGASPELEAAFAGLSKKFKECAVLRIGGRVSGALKIPYDAPATPLDLFSHLAVKLVFNTLSTGIMVMLGRVAGNWMSWVDCTNKKLLDRGTRLVSELGGIPYEEACALIFEALDGITRHPATQERAKPSAVQLVLKKLDRNRRTASF